MTLAAPFVGGLVAARLMRAKERCGLLLVVGDTENQGQISRRSALDVLSIIHRHGDDVAIIPGWNILPSKHAAINRIIFGNRAHSQRERNPTAHRRRPSITVSPHSAAADIYKEIIVERIGPACHLSGDK